MNLYLRIEVLARELQGRLLLALVAAERGHEVLLGKQNHRAFDPGRNAAALPPGLFHDKSLGVMPAKRAFHHMLADSGFVITAQDEEHGLAEDTFAPMAGRFDAEAMARTSLLFAWGEFDKQALHEILPEYTERIVPTGSSRVDFWRPELRPLLSARDPHPGDAPVILFVASGGEQLFAVPPVWEQLGAAPLADLDVIRKSQDLSEKLLYTARVRCAIEQVAEAFPSATVIVRPHPAGQPGAWERLLRFAPENVRVVSDNAVSPWIERSTAVIMNGSTVAFEVAASGRLGIAFMPDGYDYASAANRVLARVETVDSLIASIQSRSRVDSDSPGSGRNGQLQRPELLRRFASLSGPLAADRIVDSWESLPLPGRGNQVDLLAKARAAYKSHQRVGARFVRRALDRRREEPVTDPSALQVGELSRDALRAKFPPFDLGEIRSLHRGLSSTLGRFTDVQITPVHDRLLHLRSHR